MTIGSYFDVDPRLELLMINLYMILNLIAEPCVFNIYSNLRIVDDIVIKGRHSAFDIISKLFISIIIVVKCSTSYVLLGCQIISMYPIFYSDLADLLLPLVMVSTFRNVILNTVELILGILLCSSHLIPLISCTAFILKYIFFILTSCYYTFIVLKCYNYLIYEPKKDDDQPELIDNEDLVKKKRDSELARKSYSDESIFNLSISECDSGMAVPLEKLKQDLPKISVETLNMSEAGSSNSKVIEDSTVL